MQYEMHCSAGVNICLNESISNIHFEQPVIRICNGTNFPLRNRWPVRKRQKENYPSPQMESRETESEFGDI